MTTQMLFDPSKPFDKRRMTLQRYGALKTRRSSINRHWSDITSKLLPRSGRFDVADQDRGGRARYNNIYDNTGTRALRILGAGMMTGASSPARPWFELTTEDPDLAKFSPVKIWLEDVVVRMQRVFRRSNTYRSLHQMYEQLGAFGTAASLVVPQFDTVIHHTVAPLGEFCLDQDYRGNIVAFYREFQKTVGQVVKEFGKARCSKRVQDAWNQRKYENPVKLLHVIEPRADEERDPTNPSNTHMPWRSVYMELDNAEDTQFLRESGFRHFPVLAPRWAVDGGDVYGHSPGMEALGDIRQLQQEQLRKGQAIDYQTKPPLQVPTSLKDREHEMFPGGVSYYEPGMMLPFDATGPASGIRTAFEVKLQLDVLLQDIQDVRERIRSSFHADLFMMLALAGNTGRMTATEVAERHEEKLLILGPTLERLHNELLSPLIDITFHRMMEAGALPAPPPDLEGREIQPHFVSILAQAQRAVGSNSLDRFINNTTAVSQIKPDVLDKVNFDRWVDRSADILGVDPDLIVDDEAVAALRQKRAEAQAAEAQVAMQREQAATAKDLAQSPTGGGNALSDIATALNDAGEAPLP